MVRRCKAGIVLFISDRLQLKFFAISTWKSPSSTAVGIFKTRITYDDSKSLWKDGSVTINPFLATKKSPLRAPNAKKKQQNEMKPAIGSTWVVFKEGFLWIFMVLDYESPINWLGGWNPSLQVETPLTLQEGSALRPEMSVLERVFHTDLKQLSESACFLNRSPFLILNVPEFDQCYH